MMNSQVHGEVSNTDEFCIKNEELWIKNEELCIQNEYFCIYNDKCLQWLISYRLLIIGRQSKWWLVMGYLSAALYVSLSHNSHRRASVVLSPIRCRHLLIYQAPACSTDLYQAPACSTDSLTIVTLLQSVILRAVEYEAGAAIDPRNVRD